MEKFLPCQHNRCQSPPRLPAPAPSSWQQCPPLSRSGRPAYNTDFCQSSIPRFPSFILQYVKCLFRKPYLYLWVVFEGTAGLHDQLICIGTCIFLYYTFKLLTVHCTYILITVHKIVRFFQYFKLGNFPKFFSDPSFTYDPFSLKKQDIGGFAYWPFCILAIYT